MAMGRDGSEEWGFCSHLAWFCLTQSPHDGENFLTPSPSLEAPQSLPVPKMRLPKFLSCSYYQACPCPKCMLGGALKMETNCGNGIVENGREKKRKKKKKKKEEELWQLSCRKWRGKKKMQCPQHFSQQITGD